MFFFFFQAEDGIRDRNVTGVQTCALPISPSVNRYTQFTDGGRLPDSYDFWRRQAPMLHAMDFDQIVANDMVILRSEERRVGKECRCGWATWQEKKNETCRVYE